MALATAAAGSADTDFTDAAHAGRIGVRVVGFDGYDVDVGISALVGMRYCVRFAFMIRPVRRSKRVFSKSAMLIPQTMPPTSWLRAVLAFKIRPASKAPTNRVTRTDPRSGSTSTSAKCAPNACCAKRPSSASSGLFSSSTVIPSAGIAPPAPPTAARSALRGDDDGGADARSGLRTCSEGRDRQRGIAELEAHALERNARESRRPAGRRRSTNRCLVRSFRTAPGANHPHSA